MGLQRKIHSAGFKAKVALAAHKGVAKKAILQDLNDIKSAVEHE